MANFATLLSTIAANIYTNNNNEIDADDLKGVLNTMVQELGQAGYIFAGVAVPSTSPGTPDSNVFYIAGKGTYSNFGSTVVGDGQIGVFAYNGSWSYNVLDTGAWFDVDVYPAEAALEMTFYDGSHPDGETIKINANVSNLGNSKLEAISAWWAAQKERRINEIGGFTIEKDSVVDSSPTTLGLFQYIAQGQIIDSITGATSLIFVSNDTPGQEVTVNAADLPYTAAKTFVSVKSPSGTLTNVKIHVEPENFVSVSQNTQTGKTELLIGDTAALIVDNEPEVGSDNLVKSGGVQKTKVTIKSGKNLLNPVTCKVGFYINRNTGAEQANVDYYASDFIPVSESGLFCTPYSAGGANRGAAVYNVNKEYLREATNPYVYQDGDAYVRYTLGSLDTIVEVGTVSTGYVVFNPVGGYTDKKYHKLASKIGTKITGVSASSYNVIDYIDILPIKIGTTIKNNGIPVVLCGRNDESVTVASNSIYETTFEVSFIKTSSTAGDIDIDVYGELSFNDVKGNLPFNRVNIDNNTIDGSKIVDKSLEIEKFKDTEIVVGVNKLNTNDPDFYMGTTPGAGINKGTGAIGSGSSYSYGYTGFIPVSKNGLFCNAFILRGVYGAAVYDKNKQYIRSGIETDGIYTYQEGDAYIRYSLDQNPVSPYLEGQFQVNEGTTGLPYEEYSEKTIISKDVLPDGIGSITSYEQISDGIKKDIMGYNVDISIPDVIPVVVGDRLQIFWKSVIVAPNPYIFDVYAVSGSKTCKSYPRYLQCEPTVAGNISVTIYIKSPSGLVIKSKAITIRAIAPMTAPASNTKILIIGASATASGYIADELHRRLTTNTGDGTPANPTGLNLSNIQFVGRKHGYHSLVPQEATGGWSWESFAYSGQLAYRFQVTEVNLITIGSTYMDSNSQFVFEVTETNITDGSGNIRCIYTGSGTIPESGTLTLVSGDSDATITYTSFEQEAGNPFWNPVTQKLDFTSYANDYCGGSIDVIISHLGMNNIKTAYTDLQALFDGAISDFITAYHAEFPNGKFIFSTLPLGSVTGGLGSSYGADYFWNFYTLAKALWDYAEFARNYFATNEFDYVYVADVVPVFDCENLYPSTPTPVDNRSSVTELLGTNGVHPLEIGSRTVADAIYEKINDVL